MDDSSNQNPARPMPNRRSLVGRDRHGLAFLFAATLSGCLALPAAAQEVTEEKTIRMSVPDANLLDAERVAAIRRQIASHARQLCDRGSVGAIYGNGARRCREQAIADAERQLQAKIAYSSLLDPADAPRTSALGTQSADSTAE